MDKSLLSQETYEESHYFTHNYFYKIGCKDAAGQCHSVGSEWDENTESQCVTKSCNVEGLTYFEKIITHGEYVYK